MVEEYEGGGGRAVGKCRIFRLVAVFRLPRCPGMVLRQPAFVPSYSDSQVNSSLLVSMSSACFMVLDP